MSLAVEVEPSNPIALPVHARHARPLQLAQDQCCFGGRQHRTVLVQTDLREQLKIEAVGFDWPPSLGIWTL